VLDVLTQDFVDDGLIVAPAGRFNLVSEPIENFVIETDGDSCLPLGTETTAPRFALWKSYSRFMMFLLLISLSRRSHTRGDQSHIFATASVHDDEEAATPISSQGDPPFLVF
jgi:hypothetical protein